MYRAVSPTASQQARAYRPQTNGKVERHNCALLDEWAYLRPCTTNDERTAARQLTWRLQSVAGLRPPMTIRRTLLQAGPTTA
ncbi:hypothetical protein TNCT6_41480 [Streptomyces sp. 6-11-2]|nr:hypothetical protein TNCT6_41480 [Streptomyces sp. 6-11-2]